MLSLEARLGLEFFDYQLHVLEQELGTPDEDLRVCLYYKTGAGKTITALALLADERQLGEALVIAPPTTHRAWMDWGEKFGITVFPISHAKFRQKDYKVSRTMPMIVDEFHLLGGHTGQGWKKMDRVARSLKAPLILASATPNYNDAERVYCIQHVLDPSSCKGGYLEFLYTHCTTEQNPFGMTPKVTGFQNFANASEYLAALPHVYYLPDDVVYTIDDIAIPEKILPEMDRFGLDLRRNRVIASGIEEKHARINQSLVKEDGLLENHVFTQIMDLVMASSTPVLVFSNHSTVADALGMSLFFRRIKHAVVTGKTPAKKKQAYIDAFKDCVLDVLVGTASLATGTDGMDKICNTLIILDDTEDDSLRRQVIGRIMPRGADTDATQKKVYRLVLTP